MPRAGREPAEDVKRRLVAACQEVGLNIENAHMHLLREASTRIIHVGASIPGWPHDTPMLSVTANVEVSGAWRGCVDIRCAATERDPVALDAPWMNGRHAVAIESLIEQLQETLQERRQVIAMAQAGQPGPYVFDRAVWARVDLREDTDFLWPG